MENKDIQDDMLISYLLGEASPGVVQQVEGWRSTDPACNRRFEEFKLLWEASRQLDDDQPLDTEAAFYRYKEGVAVRQRARARSLVNRKIRARLAVAAGLLLFTGFAWLYFSMAEVKSVQVITGAETRTASLPDGSVVTLNHLSRLEYPSRFSGSRRQVKLDSGEAFFSVVHNKARPFLINTGRIQIRVVGTSFNVRNKKGTVEIIVETGLVQVSIGKQQTLLRPGERLVVRPGSEKLQTGRNPDRLYTYYRTRKFVADNTPLWRMAEVLNEAYGCRIVIGRKELYNLPLNTTFEDASLDKILDVISRTFRLTVERKNGIILIK